MTLSSGESAELSSRRKRCVPPWYAVAYLVVCLSFSFYWLSFDGTESLSPEAAGGAHRSVPVGFLACFRCCVAVLHLCTLVVIASDRTFNVVTDYYNVKLGSALKKERIEMSGLERCAAFFTVWTYAAQGASFALAAWSSLALLGAVPSPPQLARAAQHTLFELSSGSSMLITVVVSFLIWPELIRNGQSSGNLQGTASLLMHNATLFEVLTELVIGKVSIHRAHLPYSVLWAAAYISFTWIHGPRLAKRATSESAERQGAHFMYFFVDWTLPAKVYLAFLSGLLLVLLLFNALAMGLQTAVTQVDAAGVPIWAVLAAVYAAGSFLTKWNDSDRVAPHQPS